MSELEEFKKELIILDTIIQDLITRDPLSALTSGKATIISKDFSFQEEYGYSALEKLFGSDLTPKTIN